MRTARIAIIGAGAIGGIAAAVLADLGHRVTLCTRGPARRLLVELDGTAHATAARIATDPAVLRPVDWVLLATKAQDTPGTLPWLDRLTGPDTVVAVLQNGIDHEVRVAPLVPHATVLPAVVRSSGSVIAPGHVRADADHRYAVPAGRTGAAFAALFGRSRIAVEQHEDFTTAAWRKLLTNISVSPITALTLSPIGILRRPAIRALARSLLAEAVETGRAAGAALDARHIDALLDDFAARDPDRGTSMYHDRLAGKPLEHEHLTGALVRTAGDHGIDVPFNRAVLALLDGIGGVQNHIDHPLPAPEQSP